MDRFSRTRSGKGQCLARFRNFDPSEINAICLLNSQILSSIQCVTKSKSWNLKHKNGCPYETLNFGERRLSRKRRKRPK